VGLALGYLADGYTASSIISAGGGGGGKSVVLKLIVSPMILGTGLAFALVMGAVGGLLPSLSAVRGRPLGSLRQCHRLLAIIDVMDSTTTISEADILEKLVGAMGNQLSPDAARGLLNMKFDAETTRSIRRLLQKNNRGRISAEERLTLENYLRVGLLVDLLHAKAKATLA